MPVNAVVRETRMKPHAAVGVVNPEHSGEFPAVTSIRHDSRIENAVGCGEKIAWDHRVGRVAPHYVVASLRAFLPGNIWEGLSFDFNCHNALFIVRYIDMIHSNR